MWDAIGSRGSRQSSHTQWLVPNTRVSESNCFEYFLSYQLLVCLFTTAPPEVAFVLLNILKRGMAVDDAVEETRVLAVDTNTVQYEGTLSL